MILKSLTAAALALGLCATSQAATYTFNTDALANSTAGAGVVGASAVEGALILALGQSFSVATDPNQIWHGAVLGDPNYSMLTSNADGSNTLNYAPFLSGIGQTSVGTLVADINGDYRKIGAGLNLFSAWGAGELKFHYADINNGDNAGLITSVVNLAAVPEPESYAMLLAGLGVIGALARHRKAEAA